MLESMDWLKGKSSPETRDFPLRKYGGFRIFFSLKPIWQNHNGFLRFSAGYGTRRPDAYLGPQGLWVAAPGNFFWLEMLLIGGYITYSLVIIIRWS